MNQMSYLITEHIQQRPFISGYEMNVSYREEMVRLQRFYEEIMI